MELFVKTLDGLKLAMIAWVLNTSLHPLSQAIINIWNIWKALFFLFFQGVGYKNVTFAWIGFTITFKILLEENVAQIYLFLHLHHSPTRFRGLHIILRCIHFQTTRPNVFYLLTLCNASIKVTRASSIIM